MRNEAGIFDHFNGFHMIDLLLPLLNHNYQYVLCTDDEVFLTAGHPDLEKDKISPESLDAILEEAHSFPKTSIQKMVWRQKDKSVTLYMRDSDENDITLQFVTGREIKRFIQSIPGVQKEVHNRATAMPVLINIWLLLTVYAFIWAGTRESPEDVNPRGIILRIAYFAVLLMQKIVMAIGQTATLWIGILLLLGYSWLFYEQYVREPDTIVYNAGPTTATV